MMELRNITKSYLIDNHPYYALKNISLKIEKKEMVAVMGRSGAGKSTLLHIIGCLDTYDSGTYLLDGRNTDGLTQKELALIRNEKIGFVLQDFSLINHKSVLYNVAVPLLFSYVPFHEIRNRALEVIKKLGIESQAKKEAINLSGGQRQRVAIARAIINDAPIILADEPTGNLDSATSRDIMNVFENLNKAGKTVVIVTHDYRVADCCKRIVNISDGHISL